MFNIFIIAIILFLGAGTYFYIKKEAFGSELPWLVSFITVISYAVMLALNAGQTDPVLYTRWLGYAASCTLLTLSMLGVFGVHGKDRLTALIMTPLIMLTGFLASLFSGDLIIAGFIFALGCVPFLRLILILRARLTTATKPIIRYVYFGWMGFPVVFLLSSEFFGILPSVALTLTLYLLLDITTKIIFYFSLNKAKLVQSAQPSTPSNLQ